MATKKLLAPYKGCSWKTATKISTFESEDAAKEYIRSQAYSFDILKNMDLVPQTFAKKSRFDFFAAMSSDINPTMRKMANLLVRDSTPKAGSGNWVRPVAVSEVKMVMEDFFMATFQKANNVHLKNWLLAEKALGRHKMTSVNSQHVREEFASLWARLKRENSLPVNEVGYTAEASKKAVDAMRKEMVSIYDSILAVMKKSGVEGAENVVQNSQYLNRVYSASKMQMVLSQPNGMQRLKNFLVNAMIDDPLKITAKGRRVKKDKPLTTGQKMVIAENLIKVVQKAGITRGGINLDHILTTMQKREMFRRTLADYGLLEKEIDEIVNNLFKVPAGSIGFPTFLRRRIKFDEGYTDGKMNFSDLLENNGEALFLNYVHATTGDIALASKGIKSRGDWTRLRQQVLDDYVNSPNLNKMGLKGKWNQWLMHNEIQAMDMVYDFIKGKPLAANPNGLSPMIGRFIRKLNYTRVMNQVGSANMAEAGNVTGLLGWTYTMKHLPEFRRIMVRLKNGQAENKFIEELDRTAGYIGNHSLIQQVTNRIDDFGHSMNPSKITKSENLLDRGTRFTNIWSAQFATTSSMQKFTIYEFTHKWASFALGIGEHPFAKLITARKNRMSPGQMQLRMDDLGISPSMLERINKEFATHTKWTKGELGTRIAKADFEKWEQETRAAYIMAMRRLAHRVVQQADIGERAYFGYVREFGMDASGHLGQIAYQFRSFMFSAWAKQFLYGLKMRDAIVFDSFMNSMLWGGMMFTAQTTVQAQIHPNKEEFLENRLAPDVIAKAAFQRAAFSSLLPMGANLMGSIYTDEPIFGYRTSGLDTNIVTGNPTYSLIFQKLLPAFKAISQSTFNPTRQFSQSDANKAFGILPFQNLWGVQNVLRALAGKFPESRQQ